MKKAKKIMTILMLIIMATTILSIGVFAKTNPKDFNQGTETSAFDSIGDKIIGGVRAIGTIVAVVILIVLGIKYMLGSAEEKAEYKKTMIPYLVGAVLIFAAAQIAGFVYTFASSIS